jgi:Sulfotransferase domain
MPIPNLLVVGCQKCGTTWMHRSLAFSGQIFASSPKELDFFNKHNIEASFSSYLAHFPDQASPVKYYMESTPHYFQLPYANIDIAQNIKTFLGNPKLLVIFRDPVERYESAYTHHMMKDRLPYTPIISEFDSRFKMLELGHYGMILAHWKSVFPDINVHLYDRLKSDSFGLIEDIMSYLDIENDIRPEQLDFRTNDKAIKIRKLSTEWEALPKLDSNLRLKLIEYYRPHVRELADLLQTDLSHWLSADPA